MSGFPAAATTDVEDIDGGPPMRCWRQVWQRPPPMLKTSMAGPLGLLLGFLVATTTDVDCRANGAPLNHANSYPALAVG
jgi:hypothetical protein